MLPIAELEEGASRLLSANANRHRKTRDRLVTAEVRAIRRRRGWTVVGSETSFLVIRSCYGLKYYNEFMIWVLLTTLALSARNVRSRLNAKSGFEAI
ncbi:unnamed protein product [Colias eurytheme]|nr:unnamed protein product [Colias eurytheme]